MPSVSFSPFLLDLTAERLWRDGELVSLRPKSIAVLRYLIERRDRVVSQDELRHSVWSGTVVSPAVVKVCIQEIRAALGDNSRTPRFLVTAPRQGYRFIAPLELPPPSPFENHPVSFPPEGTSLVSTLVGREGELAQLFRWLDQSRRGERQVVLLSGEPGIGKTTLVDAFLARLAPAQHVWIARGQCIEHHGASEAYLPLLEAMERLGRGPARSRITTVLNQYAPTWLAQLPPLHDGTNRHDLQHLMRSATPERMLREMATALEALTANGTAHEPPLLVVVLEDMHWSDYSTLDLLSLITQRRGPARLLVIATYRTVEPLATDHPLRTVAQELLRFPHCHALKLEGLGEEAVREYLRARFPVSVPPSAPFLRLAHTLHRRTEGHPLFLVSVTDDLAARGLLKQLDDETAATQVLTTLLREIPEHVRYSIATQTERLPEEDQRLLEAASVAGLEFSTAAVAAALEPAVDVVHVEERCARLARRQLFLHAGAAETWPDGTLSTRYRFRHALHRDALYERVTATRGAQLHRRIGEREEAGYGTHATQRAAELARHFEQGRDFRRAVYYLGCAADTAMRKHAYREAIDVLTKALALLSTWPETTDRWQQELLLQISLAISLLMTRGFTAPEVDRAYARAHALCQQIGTTPQLFPVLEGLQTFYAVRGELRKSHDLGLQLLSLAQQANSSALTLEAHHVLGDSFLMQSDFSRAREHLEQALALYDPQQHSEHAFLYSGHDPGVCCASYAAFTWWDLGYPEQARRHSQQALTLARQVGHPYSEAMALYQAAYLHFLLREAKTAQTYAEAAMALATEHGFPHWIVMGQVLRGWALAEQGHGEEGLAQIRQGQAACQTIGIGLGWSGTLFQLAETCGKTQQFAEGIRVVEDALVYATATGERCFETELLRLKGELLLQSSRL
ncbi:MAG: AAA family ATPase [Deltaproteobacteria bacterium]|nr:AAA family ATPase [Deltaproteobacteria bacterium]